MVTSLSAIKTWCLDKSDGHWCLDKSISQTENDLERGFV